MKTLGDRVRDARLKLKLSQEDLAKKASVSQGAISGLESGRNKTSKELHKIASALGESVEFLVNGDNSESSIPETQKMKKHDDTSIYLPKLTEAIKKIEQLAQNNTISKDELNAIDNAIAENANTILKLWIKPLSESESEAQKTA